ncbi:MAG: hypothetical protein ABS939_10850 [Psychrobacillus sp.]
MANTEREAILIMLLTETVRRLTKNGKNPIHITNGQIERNLEAGYEVDYSSSDSNKFILKLVEGEEVALGIEVSNTPKEES